MIKRIGRSGTIEARWRPGPWRILGSPDRRSARCGVYSSRGRSAGSRTGSCWSGSRTRAARRPRRPSPRWWVGTGRWSSAPAERSSATPTGRRTPSRRRSCSWPAGPVRSGSATRWPPGCTRSPAGSRADRGRPRPVDGPSRGGRPGAPRSGPTRRLATTSARPSTRRSSGSRNASEAPWSSATSRASPTNRPPSTWPAPSGPSGAAWPGVATGSVEA